MLAFCVAALLALGFVRTGKPQSLTIVCPDSPPLPAADPVRTVHARVPGRVVDLRQRALSFASDECRRGANHVDIVATPGWRSTELRVTVH